MQHDLTSSLQESVLAAAAVRTALQIRGGHSKSFYGRETTGQYLDVAQHQGIINYQPTELVITARAGTRVQEIQQILAEQGQMLAFEPPCFAESATLGGTIACGFSGPRRPYTGSARDFVLGCKIINGKGEILSFGGEVMKNVAGYDVSRLMVGAMGTLGVLLEISLKVLPQPACEKTRCFELRSDQALSRMIELGLTTSPVSGLSYDGSMLYLRLSGAEKAVLAAGDMLGGSLLDDDCRYWQGLREQKQGFFRAETNCWRISVAPATPPLPLAGDWYIEWGGALRWLTTDEPADVVFTAAGKAAGHAILFRGQDRSGEIFQPLSSRMQQLHQNLKQAFDPPGILNPFRKFMAW